MTNKKKIAMAVVVLTVLATVITGSWAYFTDDATAHNVITSGGVKIELVELQGYAEDDTPIPWPEEGVNVMPGVTVTKIVLINNVGRYDAWVRIKVSEVITDADGEDISETFGTENAPVVSLNFPENNGWHLEDDGYYYYDQPLGSGGSTKALIESVMIAPGLPNDYQGCTANVIVVAHAVQYKNNADQEGQTYKDALGWPTEN